MDTESRRTIQPTTDDIELVFTKNMITNDIDISPETNEQYPTFQHAISSTLFVILSVLVTCICMVTGIIVVYFTVPRPSKCTRTCEMIFICIRLYS